eukprot:9117798-Alexandrium_andersonii.AAC.1
MQRTARTLYWDLWVSRTPGWGRVWRRAPVPPSRISSRAGATARSAVRHCLAVRRDVSVRTLPWAIR